MSSLPAFHSIQFPVFLIVLFGGLGVAGLFMLYRRNRQIQEAAEAQFKDFRERAVGLMDQIDALRGRHKALPSTDPDFTQPMKGATLALYEKVATDLDRLWERWLAVMELWNEAERRMQSTSTFSAGPSEEARAMIAGSRLEELLRDSSLCKDELDRLNLAHEVAARAVKDARREAEAMITADPIGAAGSVERSLDALEDLKQPPAARRPHGGFDYTTNPSRTILDDLVLAAGRLQELASKIRVIDIVGLLIKGWVALWVLGLFLAILPGLMPLILLFMAFVVFGSGFRVFQRIRAPWAWDWTGPSRKKTWKRLKKDFRNDWLD